MRKNVPDENNQSCTGQIVNSLVAASLRFRSVCAEDLDNVFDDWSITRQKSWLTNCWIKNIEKINQIRGFSIEHSWMATEIE